MKDGEKDVAEQLLTQAAAPAAVVPKVRTAVGLRERSGS